MNFLDPRLPARFWGKCIPEPMSGCWLWFGAHDGHGYGSFYINRKVVSAHRITFQAVHGCYPADTVTDHLCRVPCCVNPGHLEAVTRLENTRRGVNQIRRICARGHVFDQGNTYRYTKRNGTTVVQQCRACGRENARRWREKRDLR